jgi:hypothetical protein
MLTGSDLIASWQLAPACISEKVRRSVLADKMPRELEVGAQGPTAHSIPPDVVTDLPFAVGPLRLLRTTEFHGARVV